MRKIEQQMLAALINGNDFKSGNTRVSKGLDFDGNEVMTVTLHDNLIATYDHNKRRLDIEDGGWESRTTQSRLNAILWEIAPAWRIVQRNWNWYLDDIARDNESLTEWKGSAVFVSGALYQIG